MTSENSSEKIKMKMDLIKLFEKNMRAYSQNKIKRENKLVKSVMRQVQEQIKDIKKTGYMDLVILKRISYYEDKYGKIKDHTPLKESYKVAGVTHLIKAEGSINKYELFGPIKQVFNNLEKQGLNPYIHRKELPAIFDTCLVYSLRIKPKL